MSTLTAPKKIIETAEVVCDSIESSTLIFAVTPYLPPETPAMPCVDLRVHYETNNVVITADQLLTEAEVQELVDSLTRSLRDARQMASAPKAEEADDEEDDEDEEEYDEDDFDEEDDD